jgi:hypothetical protein
MQCQKTLEVTLLRLDLALLNLGAFPPSLPICGKSTSPTEALPNMYFRPGSTVLALGRTDQPRFSSLCRNRLPYGRDSVHAQSAEPRA